MSLERLNLLLPIVSDLKPLAGFKLIDMTLVSGSVRDLTPLIGMPLEKLFLETTSVKDLSPLIDLPLKRILISAPPDANLEVLRSIRTLQFINDKPVEQFWSEFQKAGAPRSAQGSLAVCIQHCRISSAARLCELVCETMEGCCYSGRKCPRGL